MNISKRHTNKGRHLLFGWLACLISMGGLQGCANRVAPTGGDPDKTPPEVVKTDPEVGTLFFSGTKIKVYFDESIQKPSVGKEVFISPLPVTNPKLLLSDSGKKIRIKFEDPIRDSTTYVITLNEFKDNNAGNTAKEAYTFAFSSGGALDSMEISGQVQSPLLGKGQAEMKILLYPVDSIEGTDFFRKRPDYLTQTDEAGNFQFKYLRNTPYKILGVIDTDQSNTLSQPSEMIAMAEDPVVAFSDSINSAAIFLYAFQPDDQAPAYRGYDWLNDSLLIIRFNERFLVDSLQVALMDTLGENAIQSTRMTYLGGTEHELMVHALRKRELPNQLRVTHLMDSLGNREDTLVTLRSSRVRRLERPLFQRPQFSLLTEQVELTPAWLPAASDTLSILLTDTTTQKAAGRDTLPALFEDVPFVLKYPYHFEIDGFNLALIPDFSPEPGQDFILHVPGSYIGLTDTVFRYRVSWPDITEYGTWSGVIKIPDYEGKVVVHLIKDDKIQRTTFDTLFSYRYLEPGDYWHRIVMDADSNQTWTPGALEPYRLPEKIFESPVQVNIRANWDIEQQIIDVDLNLPIQAPPPDTTATRAATRTDPGRGGLSLPNRQRP